MWQAKMLCSLLSVKANVTLLDYYYLSTILTRKNCLFAVELYVIAQERLNVASAVKTQNQPSVRYNEERLPDSPSLKQHACRLQTVPSVQCSVQCTHSKSEYQSGSLWQK